MAEGVTGKSSKAATDFLPVSEPLRPLQPSWCCDKRLKCDIPAPATHSDLHSSWPSTLAGASEARSVPPGFAALSSLVPKHLQTR